MISRIRSPVSHLAERFKKANTYDRFVLVISLGYILVVSVYMIWHRAWFSPDQFFVFAFIIVLIFGKAKQFLWDWMPVILLLFGYEYLRGLAPILTQKVHIFPMIKVDEYIFGGLPTIKLQSALFHQQVVHWYDYLAVILYISHFVIPMFIAFMFWLDNRRHFKEYAAAMLILSYGAFATFVVFPAMPPWMASNEGFIPPLQKIMDQVLANFAYPIDVPSVYRFFGANLVAAVPSLHAAYPWLIFLFMVRRFKLLGVLLLPYVFGVWFSIVYLGEHYVVDAMVGALYATLAFLFIVRFHKIKQGVIFLKQRLTRNF